MSTSTQRRSRAQTPPEAAPGLSFSGHETFPFRYTWLKKAVDAVVEDPAIFGRDSAIIALGVGKNMVRSMRHWALAMGLVKEERTSRGARLEVTDLGRFLFGVSGVDPYLEDPNTLWYLHWRLFRGTRCTTWRWAFSKMISHEFTRETLLDVIQDELRRTGARPQSEATLQRDVEVFIRTYVLPRASKHAVAEDSFDCPLIELHLIEGASQPGHFRFQRGPKPSLSDGVFLAALIEFWDAVAAERQTLSFQDIGFRADSPGTVFKLDEASVAERLERMDFVSGGAIGYAETAGVRQVYRKRPLSADQILKHYYSSTSLVEVEG